MWFGVFLITMHCLCTVLANQINMYNGHKTGEYFFMDKIKKIFNAPINLYYDITPIGQIMKRFDRDFGCINGWIFHEVNSATYWIMGFFSILTVACLSCPKVLVGFAITIYISFKVQRYCIHGMREGWRIESIYGSPFNSFFHESVTGTTILRAFEQTGNFEKNSMSLINQRSHCDYIEQAISKYFHIRFRFINILNIAITYSVAVYLKAFTSVPPIFIIVMMHSSHHLQGNTGHLIHLTNQFRRVMMSLERFMALDKIAQEKEGQQSAAEYLEKQGEKDTQWPKEGKIEFNDVELRYRPETDMVLKKLNLEIAPGEKVGVVGRTGAGKSTIAQALTRIVEICGGSINIDGVNINEIDIQEVRKSITIISQDPTLFNGSLRYNLDPTGKIPSTELRELCLTAGLDDLLNRETEVVSEEKKSKDLEKLTREFAPENMTSDDIAEQKTGRGLYFKISENGTNLSSGEKQLVCICRAILRKNKVVLMDEATSNIDVITEQKIQSLIESQFKESTVITIAHRLNTIIKSDKVLVLSYGKVEEFDAPAKLMQNPESEFSKLLQELKKEEEVIK